MTSEEPRSGQPGRLIRTPASPNAATSRIALVDQWVARRVDEVQRASAGIDQRVELLRQAESRVIQLIESLRNETRSAEPLSRKLESMTRDTEHEVARALQAAQDQLPRLAQTVNQQIAACHDACQQVKNEVQQTQLDCSQTLRPLLEQGQAIVDSAREQITSLLQPILEQFLTQTQARLEEQSATAITTLQTQFADLATHAREQLTQELDAHAQSAAQDVRAHLASDLEQHHRELEAIVDQAKATYETQVAELRELAQSTQTQGDACLENVRSHHAHIVADLEKHHTALEGMLSRRIDELEQTSEGYVAQFEQRLADRLRTAKAGYQSQVDSAIRELRGQSQVLSEAANARLHEELTRLQGEVDTQLSWMEERMQQRIDRLTEQARTRTGQQMLQLETASQVLRQATRVPPATGEQELELSLHLPDSRYVSVRPVPRNHEDRVNA